LLEVARRISSCTRENDVVARLGGDEFAILQLEVGEATNCAALAVKILDTLMLPFSLEGNEMRISVSIGISLYSPQTLSANSLLAQSDMALYRSKDKGRNQFHFHNEEIDQEVTERVTLTNDLKQALERNELHLHYLPEVDLSTGRILGMATQVRWLHPQRGWLEAKDFVPAAEKTGIVVALGRWQLDQACQQMRAWRDQSMAPPLIAIHLSLVQLKTGPELIYDVLRTTARWNLCPWDLRFDVTEGTLAQTKWTHNDILPRLCELGVKIAINDFGTEYSSFDYLKTYKVNHLKLTQRFLDSTTSNTDNAMTLRAILNFASEAGIRVTAEGVETQEQRDALMSSGLQLVHSVSIAVNSDQAGELLKVKSAAVDDSALSADSTSENLR
jgi:predicted signal transduction protein with EAL and GGDEF domain